MLMYSIHCVRHSKAVQYVWQESCSCCTFCKACIGMQLRMRGMITLTQQHAVVSRQPRLERDANYLVQALSYPNSIHLAKNPLLPTFAMLATQLIWKQYTSPPTYSL